VRGSECSLDGPAYDGKCQLVSAEANFFAPILTPHKRVCLTSRSGAGLPLRNRLPDSLSDARLRRARGWHTSAIRFHCTNRTGASRGSACRCRADFPARRLSSLSIRRMTPQSPASDVDSAEFACKLLILPLFWRDGSFHPRGAGGREWPIGWISRSTLNWKPG